MKSRFRTILIFLALMAVFFAVFMLKGDPNLAFLWASATLVLGFMFFDWRRERRSPLSWAVYGLFVCLHAAAVIYFRPSLLSLTKGMYVLGLVADILAMYGLLILVDKLAGRLRLHQ